MAGIKGVKSGNMAKLRNLTEKDLWTMSRKEMEELLYSTSKNITASVRKLMKSEYKDISAFVSQRNQNKYAMPREIKLKTAQRMGIEQLKQELRDLSYTANLKTYNVSGTRKYAKEFEQLTGKNLKDLTPSDWENIRQKIEEGYDSTSVIQTYDVEKGQNAPDDVISDYENRKEQAEQDASDDVERSDPFNLVK